MKSIKGEGTITCPKCSEPFDAEFWTLIRGDHDDELKDALLGGEINLVSCPRCSHFFYQDKTIIYFDPPTELLAFVSPIEDLAAFPVIKEQMEKDFTMLKQTLVSLHIDYEPFYLQGLDELKKLLEYEQHVVLESEVTAAQSTQAGFKVAHLKPSVARAAQYPYYIPVQDGDYSPATVLDCAKKVLQTNTQLGLLANFVEALTKGAVLPPKI